LAPQGLPVALFVIAAELLLAYRYRENYKGLLLPKPIV